MHEACLCGWTGKLAEREPADPGDGDRGPTCPRCGHLDRLESWPTAAREDVVAGSRRRREGLGAIARTSAVGRAA